MNRIRGSFILGTLRIIIVVLVILLQVSLILGLIFAVSSIAVWVYIIIEILMVISLVVLISRNKNTSFTIAWILLIALLPVFGYILYLIWGQSDTKGPRNKHVKLSLAHGAQFINEHPAVLNKFVNTYSFRKRIPQYLNKKGFPLYQNTDCHYYPFGEMQFEAMFLDIEQAEKFVFIQTFILSEGKLWDHLSQILLRKASEGVEIRLMFDDLGSASTFPLKRILSLRKSGIQVVRYSPIHKYTLGLAINYRNHQKIVVIDGNIAYTGGSNFADEYVNYFEKYGRWKDTAIRLEGDAVWSLTITYLQMWDTEMKSFSNYDSYRPTVQLQKVGYFQPFSDGPVNNPENPAETVYQEMFTSAQEYLYITSPYLVIDNALINLLCTTSASGVDVRIILPHIWDKWYVREVSRSNYKELLSAGVRIYEYTPGFMHGKMICIDDHFGVIGSINMDYRSFHHHFENGVWICEDKTIAAMKTDFLNTIEESMEIKLPEFLETRSLPITILSGILRVFSVMF